MNLNSLSIASNLLQINMTSYGLSRYEITSILFYRTILRIKNISAYNKIKVYRHLLTNRQDFEGLPIPKRFNKKERKKIKKNEKCDISDEQELATVCEIRVNCEITKKSRQKRTKDKTRDPTWCGGRSWLELN